ncbi:hypothetical protein [Nocardia tengchongensis]|uniref:hypothetical protein n=1 Tax=Nocardia tengchongensis TaxID=2055889 RepID=UPI00361A1AF7
MRHGLRGQTAGKSDAIAVQKVENVSATSVSASSRDTKPKQDVINCRNIPGHLGYRGNSPADVYPIRHGDDPYQALADEQGAIHAEKATFDATAKAIPRYWGAEEFMASHDSFARLLSCRYHSEKEPHLFITRLAVGTVVASAAVLMFGTSSAVAEITLDPPSTAADVQGPQPIAGLPSTGSLDSFGKNGCVPVGPVVNCY